MESDTLTFQHIMDILDEYMDEFKRVYKDKLQSDGRVATGDLIQSVTTEVKVSSDTYKVIFNANEYYKWIEDGRKPASNFPPVDKILSWIRAKGITPLPSENGKLPTEKQLAFLIGRAIANNGTIKDKGYDGGHYLAQTVQELNDIYIPRLQEALEKDWEDYAIRIYKDIGRTIKI